MATINLTQLKKEKEAKPASSFNNAPTIVLNKGKSSVETPRTNYDFSDRTAEPVQRKTLQTPVVTTPQTTTVNQQINRPAQQDQYGLWDNAGYVVEQAGKGLQGGIGGLVNAASTFLDKPLQTVNAIGSFGSKFSTSNDYSQYDPATAEALRQKDAEIEQLRRQMYSNLDENFLDPIAQKGVELGAGMIAESQESSYDRDKLSMISRFGGDVAKAVGGMAPSIAASVIATPFAGAATASTIGLSVMGTGAYGQSLQQALNDGASYDDAVVYGLASAGVEIATEKLFGGIPFFGEGAVDDVLKEWMQAKLGTGTGKKVVEYLVDSIGEGAEEYISEVAGEFLVDIYTDERKDKDFFDRLMDVQDDAFYSFLLGAVTGGVMGAPRTILQSIKSGKTQEQSAEAQTTPTEKDPMKAMINEDAKVEAQKIVADMGQSTPVNDYITNGLRSNHAMLKMEAQRKNTEQILKSAKDTGVDTKVAKRIAQVANRTATRVVFKDLTYTFEDTDGETKTIHPEGMYENGVIYISPNSINPEWQVYKHELTHHLETTGVYEKFKNAIFDLYDSETLNRMRENLRKERTDLVAKHKNDEATLSLKIDNELAAVLSQDKIFTDKNTIDDLLDINPNVVYEIWEWLKTQVAKFTGQLTEDELKIKKAEQLYREAIRQSKKINTNNTGVSLSKITLNDGEDVILLDNEYVNEDGTPMSERQIYKAIRNKTYTLNDGSKVEIVGYLYNKTNRRDTHDMYGELFRQFPGNQIEKSDLLVLQNKINNNFIEVLGNSEYITTNPDNKPNHKKYGIENFDIRDVNIFDGNNAYKLRLAIANLDSGRKVAYAKMYLFGPDQALAEKIKKETGYTSEILEYPAPTIIIPDSSDNSSRSAGLNADKLSERRKDLMAVHNLSDTKLKKSLELGGMPYPSIAVTKPERVVGFDEVNAAVIPNTLSDDIKQMLRERGVNMVEYDPSVEGDRQRVMNSLEDAKFSRGLNADLLANPATEKNITQKVVGYNRAQSDTLNKINGGYARGRTSSIMKQIAAQVVNSGGNYSEELRNELLDEIWDTAYTVDESNLDVYAGVRDYFKNVKMKMTDSAKAEISDYNSWRKSVSNRLHFAKDGRSIDDVYQELQSLYGEVFPDVNSEGEMLEVMADVYDYEKSKRVHLSELGVKKEDFAKDFDDILEEFKNNILYRSNKKFLDTVARKSLQKSKADMAQRALQAFGDVSDDVKALLEEHESSEGYRTSEDWSTLVPQIKSYGALSKTLSQVLDVVANSNPEVRARLYNAIEKPLYEAKKTYTTRTRKNVSKVYDEVVSKYNIKKGSKESEALMWYGEKTKSLWNKKQGKLETMPYSLDDLKKDMPNSWQNIVEADKVMRQIYDDYIDSLNDVLSVIYPNIEIKAKYELNKLKANVASLVEQKKQLEEMDLVHAKPETLALYSQVLRDLKANRTKMSKLTNDINSGDYYANKRVNKRSDYYHHFYELTASDTLQDIFDMNASNNISNALAGKSEFTKPKSKFAGFMQHRGMGKYEADAIASILDYIPKAEYKIAFDPVITEYRDIISNIVKESGEEYDNTEFINWFTNYTNDLAGKTNPIDRIISNAHNGRKYMKALRSLNNFVKGKTIVGNLASATSQFFNMPNGVALLKHRGGLNAVKDVTLGQKDYVQYIGNKVLRKSDSSPINDSVFLSERYLDGIYSKFDTGILDNVNKMRTWLLQVGDQAVSENLWFSAYEQALRLEKSNPIEYADNLVRDAVAGRGVGEIPLTQKSELVKLLAPFQVEVNNTWNLIKSLSGVQLEGSGVKEIAKNLLGGDERDYIALLTLFVITYFMNNPKEELTGNRTGFDPIDAIIDTYEKMAKEENASTGDWIASAAGRVGGEILSNMPGGNWWTTAAGLTGYDAEAFFGEADPSRFGTGVTGVQAVVDPLMQFAIGKNVDWQSILTNLTPIGDKQTNRMYKMAEDAGLIPRIDWNRNDGLIINGNVVGKDQEGKKVPFNEIKWEEFFKDIKNGSYNDNNGLKYPIDTSDPINMAKGFAFGTYATKEGKEYIKEGYSALSKQSTEKYEDLVKDSAKNYSDAKTYYDYFRQKEDNSYANAELLNQKAMQDAIKKIIEEGPTETDENGIVTSKYDYSDFGTTEKAMKAYAGAIAKGIDFNIIEEASKIKSVQKQDGERDSKAITHSAAALVRKFYEEKGIYKKIVDYCNHSKDTDVTAFGLATKVLDDAYYKKVLSEIEKVRKGKK